MIRTISPPTPPPQSDFVYKAKWIKDPDIIEIKCDMHGWMKGFIVVHDARYCAVTGAEARLKIKDLRRENISSASGTNRSQLLPDKTKKTETFEIEIKPGAATDLGEMKFNPRESSGSPA